MVIYAQGLGIARQATGLGQWLRGWIELFEHKVYLPNKLSWPVATILVYILLTNLGETTAMLLFPYKNLLNVAN